MPDNKFEGWDELEKVETTNIADQKNEKFEEWDNLINIEKSEIDLHKSESSTVKPVYANTNGTTSTQNTQVWGVVGIIGFALFFIFLILPLFSGGGNGGSGSDYSLSNERYSLSNERFIGQAYTATLTNTTDSTYSYRVTVRIFNSSGQQIHSNSSTYILASGGSVSIFITSYQGPLYSSHEVSVSSYKK